MIFYNMIVVFPSFDRLIPALDRSIHVSILVTVAIRPKSKYVCYNKMLSFYIVLMLSHLISDEELSNQRTIHWLSELLISQDIGHRSKVCPRLYEYVWLSTVNHKHWGEPVNC